MSYLARVGRVGLRPTSFITTHPAEILRSNNICSSSLVADLITMAINKEEISYFDQYHKLVLKLVLNKH